MSQKRKTFEPSFKLQVVQLIKEQGLSVAQVCRDMSLGETAVRRWLAQFAPEQSGQARSSATSCASSASVSNPARPASASR